MKTNTIVIIVIAMILVIVYFSIPPLGIYANDGGTKYIQMKSFYLNHWKRLDIDYPGQELGLSYSYLNPVRSFKVMDNKLFITCSPLFTYLTSLVYPFLGDRGILFFPLLSFFISIILFLKILDMLLEKCIFYYILVASFLIGSPVYLYSIIFWEHLPAVCLVMLSLYYITRYFKKEKSSLDIFLSAFFLGSSLFFRTGMWALITGYLSFLSYVFIKKNEFKYIIAMLLGFTVPIAAYFLSNLVFYGHLLGLHATSHLPYNFSLKKALVSSAILFTGYIVVGLLNKSNDKRSLIKFYYLLNFILISVLLGLFINSPIRSLVTTFPLIIMIFYGIGENIEELFSSKPELRHFLLSTVIIYISLVTIFLFNNPDTSIRYLLPAVPIALIFIGVISKEAMVFKPFYILTALLVIFSFTVNLSELRKTVLGCKYYNYKRVEFLKENTKDKDVVIFQANPLMEHAGPLYFERVYIVSKNNGRDTKDILDTLKEKGIQYCYYWTMYKEFKEIFLKDTEYKIDKYEFKVENSPTHYLLRIKL
ncbi:MAG: hypothetical protein ABIG92_05215 [Candidatus Omnitrophota bacterium]